MKIHTYLSSSGKDLIMEYINALTIEEQVDGLAVLAYMEKVNLKKYYRNDGIKKCMRFISGGIIEYFM